MHTQRAYLEALLPEPTAPKVSFGQQWLDNWRSPSVCHACFTGIALACPFVREHLRVIVLIYTPNRYAHRSKPALLPSIQKESSSFGMVLLPAYTI